MAAKTSNGRIDEQVCYSQGDPFSKACTHIQIRIYVCMDDIGCLGVFLHPIVFKSMHDMYLYCELMQAMHDSLVVTDIDVESSESAADMNRCKTPKLVSAIWNLTSLLEAFKSNHVDAIEMVMTSCKKTQGQ